MVKEYNRMIFRIFFGIELLLFSIIYLFGTHGVKALHKLHQENEQLEQEISGLRSQVQTIEHDIEAWNSHLFYKEKVAREQLQMAREDETIYYVS